MRKQVTVVFLALQHMAVCHFMLRSPHQEVVRLTATSQTIPIAHGNGGFISSCASDSASQTHARGKTDSQDSGVHSASFP